MARIWPIITGLFLMGIMAHSQKIFFEQLTTANGLPSDYVNCLFEDSKGNLWIGTDKGACRFDGRQFKYFSNDNGLSSNFISCFGEDAAGNIWIGTVNEGVNIYNGESIKAFSATGNKTYITGMLFNLDSSFFIITDRVGISYFENIHSSPRVFKDYSFIKKIGDNLFLTGTVEQLVIFEKQKKKLVLNSYPVLPDKVNFSGWMSDNSLIALKDNSVLNYTFDQHKKIIKEEFIFKKPVQLPYWTHIKKVFFTEKELLIATSNGLIVRDRNDNQHFLTAESGLGTNYIKSVFKDSHRNIYICTYGAGIKIWPAGYLTEYKINGKVTSIFTGDNETYVTTTKSVYQYADREKELAEIRIPNVANYTSIYKEKNGTIYVGTLRNYYSFPGVQFRNLPGRNMNHYAFSANSGASGFARHGKNMMIATYGDGIFLLDSLHKRIDTIGGETPTSMMIVESLVRVGSAVASLTYNSGLTLFDRTYKPVQLTKESGLLSNTVYAAFQETENKIWIGTKGGLNLYNGTDIIKTYSAQDGLIGTNVLCIFKDRMSRLWILSDKFLHLVNGDRLRAIRSHPLLFDDKSTINRAAYCITSDKLFIGLTDVLLTVAISKVIPDTVVHRPILLAVTRDSVSLALDTNRVLAISNPAARVKFRFAGNHSSFVRQNDIYYRLNGYDDNWKILSGHDAFYQKLPPGKYEMIAKSSNPDGYYSPETNLVSFEVMPALWKRSWFIALTSVLLLALFFSIGIALSKRRYKQKLRHLEEENRLRLERERIARELHDSVGSQLTYLINKIDDDHSRLAEKTEAEKLSAVARNAMQELRETIWALDKKQVPWDDLHNKIRQLIQLYKTDRHMVALDWQVNSPSPLKSLEALNIYRTIQEALNNSVKYSEASVIKVSATQSEDLIAIEINDNGKGFDTERTETGYGLKNLRKRAEEMSAKLQIESSPGAGTRVMLVLQ